MAKRSIDRRVDEAIRLLTRDREASVRDLAAAIMKVEEFEKQIRQLKNDRDEAVSAAHSAFEAAKEAGWSARDLRTAGLTPPRAPRSQNVSTRTEKVDDETGAETTELAPTAAQSQVDETHA